MSHALIGKRCTENCAKAQLTVDISRTVEAPIEEIFIFEAIPHNSKCRYGERGAADAVPQLPERCLSRKAGIVRCCLKHITNTGPHVILHAARCVISGYILFEAWGKNQTTPWLIIALAIFSKPAMLAPATRLPFMP